MIRPSSDSDIDTIMDIWLTSNREAHAFVPAAYWQQNFASVKEAILKAEVYVAEESGQVAGFLGLVGNYIAGLFVKQQARDRGIGADLLKHVQSLQDTLELDVYQENPRAVAFYQNHGFQAVQKDIDPDTGHAEYRMVWKR